jgi:hypothetical protein
MSLQETLTSLLNIVLLSTGNKATKAVIETVNLSHIPTKFFGCFFHFRPYIIFERYDISKLAEEQSMGCVRKI